MAISAMLEKNQKYFKYTCLILSAIPIILYIKNINKFAVNIPREDDYDGILDGFCHFVKASFVDRLTFFVEQSCEHRDVFGKLVVYLHYLIYGNINFRHLILFDVFLLLLVFVIFTLFIIKALPDIWQIPTLILSCGLFDLNNFENADFVSAGLFNIALVLIFFTCMILYQAKDKLIFAASFFLALLIFSGGNGMIGAFFIVLFNFLNGHKGKFFSSLMVLIIFTLLYFYKFNFGNPNSIYFTLNVTKFVPYFLCSLGANFGNNFGFIGGILVLASVVVFIPIYKRKNINPQTLPFICTTGFILASLGVMSIFRGNLPIGNAYSSRYMIYSHLLLVIISIFLFLKIKNLPTYIVTIIAAIIIYKANYDGGINWLNLFHSEAKNRDYYYPISGREHAKQVAEEACRLNIYCLEKHRND